MSVVMALVVRNLRLFFRDRLNVFFSLLGAIILFGLYTLFLSNLQTADLASSLPGATSDEVQVFVDSWMFAGIVLITTVTTGLGAFSTLVDDGQTGRFRDFLVAPLRRGQLVLGYLVAAILISLMMSLVVFAVALLYLGLLRDRWMPVDAVVRSVGIVVLSCMAFTSLAAVLVGFVRTSGAFSALATIVGTVLGFIAGAYLPMGLLPSGVATGLSVLPFAQSGMLLRREFAADNLNVIVADAPGAEESLRTFFGIDLTIGDWAIPNWFVVVVLITITAVCAGLSAVRIRARLR